MHGDCPSSPPRPGIDVVPTCCTNVEMDTFVHGFSAAGPARLGPNHCRARSWPASKRWLAIRLLAHKDERSGVLLSTCKVLACLYWMALAIMASIFTSTAVETLGDNPRATKGPDSGIGAFWFTGEGFFWWTAIWYPAWFGLSVATALHIEHHYIYRQGRNEVPRWAVSLFVLFLLSTEAAVWTLCSMSKRMTVSVVVITLTYTLAMFAVYALICLSAAMRRWLWFRSRHDTNCDR